MIGSSLSHYRVTAKLGQGGMGEVYRATDENLGRDVAIKVLPAEVAGDGERLGRFRREAQLLGSLNHTNIASLYGLEEADGKPFLVLELVEGEELSERLQRGAIPIDEAIDIAKQIAEALEEAHDRGIVHRDLKPANIKITPDGRVKVLDFGLAKAYAGEAAEGSAPNVSQSPTMSAQATQAGVILGTAAYMSPEQARGKPVDKRADIWAYGVVLFEMLTGRKLFDGETVSDVLAAVLMREPDWSALPAGTPVAVTRVLHRCLDREPRQRLHDIADARLELGVPDTSDAPKLPATSARGPGWLATVGFAVVTAAAGLALGTRLGQPETTRQSEDLTRFEIQLPEGASLAGGLSVSPDGRTVAFSARDSSGTAIWTRGFDDLVPRRLDNTQGARHPFWSPDSRSIGFFANGELRLMDLIGQQPRTVAATASSVDTRGATWSDGVIVYSPNYIGGLLKVSASGGEPESLTTPNQEDNEGTHRWPTFLPDGRHFVFYIASGTGTEPGQLAIGEIGAKGHRLLTAANSRAIFFSPSFLIYTRGKALVAQRFDLKGLQLQGDPVPLAVELPRNLANSGHRALGAAGAAFAYQVGGEGDTSVEWVDRSGRKLSTVFESHGWLFTPRLAPDGKRFALAAYEGSDPQGKIWVIDPLRNNAIQMTSDPLRDDQSAVWSPDGSELAVTSVGAGTAGGHLMKSDQPHSEEPLDRALPGFVGIDEWLPDGEGLLVSTMSAHSRLDIWRLSTQPGTEPVPVLATPANEHTPDVSADGEWFTYVSDTTGRDEVYVRRIDGEGGTWRVSSDGGTAPVWRKDGRELFYIDLSERLNAVSTTLGSSFSFRPAEPLFTAGLDEGTGGRQYDVSADGQRFLLNRGAKPATNPIVVVHGLAKEIERLLEEPSS